MLIGGEWVAGAGRQLERCAAPPAAAAPCWPGCPVGGAADADRAVAAARAAFPAWRALHFKDRQKALLRIADALEDRAEELALLTAADTGNALRTQARPESQTLVNLFRYFGGVAGEFKGTVLPAGDDQLQYTRREPLGVVAGILPWNSPLMIAGMKTPASLAAGNTLILKTAQEAPLTILKMAEIASEFLPPGVLNVVTGRGSVHRRGAAGAPGRRQGVVHRLDRGRPARRRDRREAVGPRVSGTGRQEPEHRLPGCGHAGAHRRHRGRRAHRHAVHPAGPVLHRRLPAVRARRRLRRHSWPCWWKRSRR